MIYLDNNATTELDPKVRDVMLQEMQEPASNPSSIHLLGQKAKKRLENARKSIASLLKTDPSEIIFTSGGTESMNLILRSLLDQGHVITSNIEHACVYETLQSLETPSLEVDYLSPGHWGAITLDQIQSAMKPHTRYIVLSAVNSETGVQTNIEEIAQFAEKNDLLLILDVVQLIGKEEFFLYPGISAFGFSAHKFHGPKGTGLAWIRKTCKKKAYLTGGKQEKQIRAGTENLAGILGFAKAFEMAYHSFDAIQKKLKKLQETFESTLKNELQVEVNGEGPRLFTTSNLYFPQMDAETLLIKLDLKGIYASFGSACSSGALEPSRVLTNMGYKKSRVLSSIRFSFSKFNTTDEILSVIKELKNMHHATV